MPEIRKELEKKFNGNPQRYQEAVRKLYKDNNASPTGGCLWSLLPFPILIALYGVIRQPLERMMGIDKETVETIKQWVIDNLGFVSTKQGTYDEIGVTNLIHQNWDKFTSALGDFGGKLMDLDYSFLGLNLGEIPDFKIWNYGKEGFLVAFGMFLIPVIAAFLSWASMKISQASNPQPAGQQAAQAAQSMKMMNLMMPLMSIWICFVMPAALGIYWIAQYVFSIIQEIILNKHYGKLIAIEEAERNEGYRLREEELERKRQETERLKAEGKTQVNTNTSKKKLQAQERSKEDLRRAAEAKEAQRKKRIALGLPADEPVLASQVGNRRFARGRAYVADRFTNPETAEELTRLAAEASAEAEALDEDAALPDDAAIETVEAEDVSVEDEIIEDEPEYGDDEDSDVDDSDNH